MTYYLTPKEEKLKLEGLPQTIKDAVKKSKVPKQEKDGMLSATRYSYYMHIKEGKTPAEAEKAVLAEIKDAEARMVQKGAKAAVPVPRFNWEAHFKQKISDEIAQKLGYDDAAELKKDMKKFYDSIKDKKGFNSGIIMEDRINALVAVADGKEDTFGTKRTFKSEKGKDIIMKAWNAVFQESGLVLEAVESKKGAAYKLTKVEVEEEEVPEKEKAEKVQEEKVKADKLDEGKLEEIAKKFFKDDNEKLKVGVSEDDVVKAVKSVEDGFKDEEAVMKWLADNFLENEEEAEVPAVPDTIEQIRPEQREIQVEEGAEKIKLSEYIRQIEEEKNNIDKDPKYEVKTGGWFARLFGFSKLDEKATKKKREELKAEVDKKFLEVLDANGIVFKDGNFYEKKTAE